MTAPTRSIPATRAVARKGNQTLHARTKGEKERAVVLPSTARAIELRNGKGGLFGTGELTRISGRAKMELIAEDEMLKVKEARKKAFTDSAQGALRAPFNMEVAKKVAQSQMDAYIDTINRMHLNDLCYEIVSAEIQAQCPPRHNPKDPDPFKSPAFVAEQFGILIHNSYMLASGWTIIFESLRLLERLGLEDKAVLQQLKNDNEMRTIYLLAFNLIKKLVSAVQQRLRSIVQNTEHYSKYFKAASDAKGQKVFDVAELRDLNRSYLDSAIIELCLPGSDYSPQALYHILNTVEQETPKELRRCPQIMWDTVGDLAEAVRLLDLMEMPLLAADMELQNTENLGSFAEFAQWDEAQEKSIQAALDISSFVNLVHPLTNVKSKITLDKVWDRIDGNYVRASGKKIDALWQLIDVRIRVPHFSLLYFPSEALNGGDNEDSTAQRKKPLAITQNGEDGYESNSSMPGLMEVSDSDEEEIDDGFEMTESSSAEESSGDEDDIEDDDSDYDNFEEELRKQYRQAMNIFTEMPEIFDQPPDANDRYAEERKSNPFLLLLSKLRGRMFPSSSALRTDGKTTLTTKPAAPKAKKPVPKPRPVAERAVRPSEPVDTQQKNPMQATVEDADDDSDERAKADKKKKKKKKPKKKKTTNPMTNGTPESPVVETPTSPLPSQIPLRSQGSATQSQSIPNGKVDTKQQQPSGKTTPTATPSVHSGLSGTTAYGSTVSLPLPTEQKAESARKYLVEAGLDQIKTKVKTRPDQQAEEKEKEKEGRQRLFGRFGGGTPRESDKRESPSSANAIFGRLRHKTNVIARKIFGASAQDKKGSVKWEQFLQVMRELGFSYDPSTAGSSVRFDPPNPNDRSITFHMPHPDPTLHQYKLRDIRSKLRDYYGFTFQQFDAAVSNVGRMGRDSDEE